MEVTDKKYSIFLNIIFGGLALMHHFSTGTQRINQFSVRLPSTLSVGGVRRHVLLG